MSIQLEVRSYRGGDRHHHDFSQILLPMQGAMRLDVEGRRGVVSHSCVALIPRHREHGFEPSSDCSMLILDVDVAGLGGEMPPTLLESQFATLEPLEDDEQGFEVSIDQPVEQIVESICAHLVDAGTV